MSLLQDSIMHEYRRQFEMLAPLHGLPLLVPKVAFMNSLRHDIQAELWYLDPMGFMEKMRSHKGWRRNRWIWRLTKLNSYHDGPKPQRLFYLWGSVPPMSPPCLLSLKPHALYQQSRPMPLHCSLVPSTSMIVGFHGRWGRERGRLSAARARCKRN